MGTSHDMIKETVYMFINRHGIGSYYICYNDVGRCRTWTGAHSVGRTHCVKLVHRLYPEVDPALNPDHVPHMLKKCPDAIPDPKAVQYVRNDRGTPMILDNNYYRNILDNKGLLIVDHQLANDKRTKPYVKKMAKSQDYFFREFSRAITLLSENNPLTGTKGEIRKQCSVANKHYSEEPWLIIN